MTNKQRSNKREIRRACGLSSMNWDALGHISKPSKRYFRSRYSGRRVRTILDTSKVRIVRTTVKADDSACIDHYPTAEKRYL